MWVHLRFLRCLEGNRPALTSAASAPQMRSWTRWERGRSGRWSGVRTATGELGDRKTVGVRTDLNRTSSLRGGAGVALKIIRNLDKYREAAKLEIDVLERIRETDPDQQQ